MLLIGRDFPPDIRVEKESRTLLAAGHRITLVCENRMHRPARESLNGVQIVRLPMLPRWLRRLNTATLFVTLHNPFWERIIRRLVEVEQPNALHVHDLPFVGPGLRIARAFRIPLIADLHENYPAWVEIRRGSTGRNLVESLAFNPTRFACYEQRVVPHCDYVIVVVEEAAERVRDLGVDPAKIVIVGNTEDIDAARDAAGPYSRPTLSGMVLLYVGNLGVHRGLDTGIRAMPGILEQIPTAMLVIVGDGSDRPRLERLARELGVDAAVRFEGEQPLAKVYGYIQASDICLVPHAANPHTNTTMPHKLFQYMYMRRPVVASTAIPLARVVQETEAGLIFESGNPASLAYCVLRLRDKALRGRLGENGQNAVIRRYNWRNDGQHLVRLYQEVAVG